MMEQAVEKVPTPSVNLDEFKLVPLEAITDWKESRDFSRKDVIARAIINITASPQLWRNKTAT